LAVNTIYRPQCEFEPPREPHLLTAFWPQQNIMLNTSVEKAQVNVMAVLMLSNRKGIPLPHPLSLTFQLNEKEQNDKELIDFDL